MSFYPPLDPAIQRQREEAIMSRPGYGARMQQRAKTEALLVEIRAHYQAIERLRRKVEG